MRVLILILSVLVCSLAGAQNVPNAKLASGKIFVGNASGIAKPVTPTGNVTITNAGVTAIGGSQVTSAMIVDNTIVTADIDKNVIQVANLQLTNAQVLALRATPKAITPVPAANTAFVVVLVEVVSDDTAGAWTETADDLMIEYSGGTDIVGINSTAHVGGGVTPGYYYPTGVPTIVAAANTACATTCAGSGECRYGLDVATVAFVDCANAIADSCVCGQTKLIPTAAEAIQIKNIGDGEFGGGNAANTLSIRVWYRQISTVAFSSGG